ncbi:murein DD-endopeptidase MepM/ murein hydrolase activator NlpD [Saonia flava]|uniref:Murein DD-endopeptidase MepM/ murein hydrolase activator NlpD n=1 Tax=Saonia flava TaxID=523696 RepID=A0A846R339_9FLAO|nr:peptidoglycan DD-metalloendopeptidase family protein [Saonia flava]NJB72385.1 murein DD-endopeptidase MepM/ murein hydrolase activator NlpD [Saonia flava]
MTSLERTLNCFSAEPIHILDKGISLSKYTLLDLSVENIEVKNMDMADPTVCQTYIDSILKQGDALVAYGGYLEQRGLYASNSHFSGEDKEIRNIHLGVDFWAPTGTKVLAPIKGKVHSFKNNNIKGDYGPTIVLVHSLGNTQFYTLYGHLSLESLDGLFVGKEFFMGEVLGTLGAPDVNINYAPHLHFQIIKDIQTYMGDYPGVCTTENKGYYASNCPNPYFLLKI